MATKTPFEQLEEKMSPEIAAGHPYEAMQLAESFIARKKKSVGRDVTSELVFHGAKTLIRGNASADAGTLISWYIENGAGDDYYFRLNEDLKHLDELFSSLPSDKAHPVLSKVYGPFHKFLIKADTKSTTDSLKALELKWIDIFVAQRDWSVAVRAILRIGDFTRVASIIDMWAKDGGYKNEYPLYFARAVFLLLGEGSLEKATKMLQASLSYVDPIDKNIASLETTHTAEQSLLANSLGVWHLAIILTDLAGMEPKPRVDKNKIFLLLSERYGNVVKRVDSKLLLTLDKIGQNFFGLSGETQVNPMTAMIQNMLAGGGSTPAAGASNVNETTSTNVPVAKKSGKSESKGPSSDLDINTMMKMLSNLNK